VTPVLGPRGRSGNGWSQRTVELAAFREYLAAEDVRSYLEVGARHGDSFAAVAESLPTGATLVAVDLPGGLWGRDGSLPALLDAAAYARSLGHTAHIIVGNSREASIIAQARVYAPYDCVFLDGDHTEDGIRADWAAYGPMGRLVGFHDIAPAPENTGIKVPLVWAEVAATHPTIEIHDPAAPGMGIGICRRVA
jgi:hypothetical protein